jgi:hypothetical protein
MLNSHEKLNHRRVALRSCKWIPKLRYDFGA